MSKTYYQADKDTQKLVESIMQEHHPVLAHVGVTINTVFVESDKGGPCLKLHGYTCAATIKKTPLKQRILGVADAVMTIDAWTWEELKPKQRKALIDHELYHLQVKKDTKGDYVLEFDKQTGEIIGDPKRDSHDRPVLVMRLHDWELGGFREIAERWRENAIEVIHVRQFQDSTGQYMWDFNYGKAGAAA